MDENSRAAIRNIKSRIVAMLDERQQLEGGGVSAATPSKYWTDFCSFFDYMLWLPEECFSKLRLHTYHLTGDNYQTYYFGNADSLRPLWEESVKDIPSEYVLNEPAGGIGFDLGNGRLVSRDILRYQHVVNTLYQYEILSSLAKADGRRRLVLEIGSGYAGLVHHLSHILPNVTYVIVDLTETLLFSASYLTLLNPHKRTYVYQPSDTNQSVQSTITEGFDFVLLPNYRLDELRRLKFDLVLNVASFQEMRTDQVSKYLDFIAQTCMGVFYSWNEDVQAKNKEMDNLSKMLMTRFALTEVLPKQTTKRLERKEWMRVKLRGVLKSAAIHVGLLDRPKPVSETSARTCHEYLCTPLGNIAKS